MTYDYVFPDFSKSFRRSEEKERGIEWVGTEQSSAICETALAVTDTPGNKCLYKGVGKFAG